MSIPFHATILPAYGQMLAGLSGVLDKARTFAAEQGLDEEELVHARLAPDMLDFAWQVKLTTVHAVNGLAGSLEGRYTFDRAAPPETLAGLAELVEGARAQIAAFDPAQVDSLVDREVLHVARNARFAAPDFLTGFSLPNFYFHLVTAYDILRGRGVPIGKADYLGTLPIRQ